MPLIYSKRGGIRHTPARTLSRRSCHNVIIQKPKRAGNAAPNPPFSEIFAHKTQKKAPVGTTGARNPYSDGTKGMVFRDRWSGISPDCCYRH